jgi:hypothetical protein
MSAPDIGQFFGQLRILSFIDGTNQRVAVVRCDCGTARQVSVAALTAGEVQPYRCQATRPERAFRVPSWRPRR